MISITLNLFATLRPYLPDAPRAVSIADGTRVSDLIDDMGIPGDMVKLIFINGKRAPETTRLKADDRVGIFPPVGGG